MQDNYVYMQYIYVYMQDNYVYMQDNYVYMQVIYVYMQDNYIYIITQYFFARVKIYIVQWKNYVVMSLQGHRKRKEYFLEFRTGCLKLILKPYASSNCVVWTRCNSFCLHVCKIWLTSESNDQNTLILR